MAKENSEILTLLTQAEELYSSLLNEETALESAACSEVLTQLDTEMEKKKSDLVQNSKTKVSFS